MDQASIAAVALRDAVDLGTKIRQKVGDDHAAQHAYWEWLASTVLLLGYQTVSERADAETAASWLTRSFESFSSIATEKGFDVRVCVMRRSD